MNILIIGSGGREHALAWKLNQSPLTSKIHCIPGNGGTKNFCVNKDIDILDFESIIKYAKAENIDLTIVGPEVPLVAGIVDAFEAHNLKIFGPNKNSAQLEGSKEFSKNFMEKHNILTAKYESATSYNEAIKKIKTFTYPLVIKADGLCAGKGVFIVEDESKAVSVLSDIFVDEMFGSEGSQVVIEQFLDGFEVSQLCFVANNKLYPLASSQDYKRIGENDTGDNTGGVGCLSPSPFVDDNFFSDSFKKIEAGLEKDNLGFYGILFIGYMIVDKKPYVLEFNARFGDPETEVILPRMQSDLVQVFLDVMNDKDPQIKWDKQSALAIVLTSFGYPHEFEVNKEISIEDDGLIFHNGTKYTDNLVSSGGRVLTVVELGDDFVNLNKKIRNRIENINFEGKTFRRDIGLL